MLLAASFSDWRDTTVLLDFRSIGEALTVFPKSGEKPRRVDGSGAGETATYFEVRELFAQGGDFVVIGSNRKQEGPQLRDEGLDHEQGGADDRISSPAHVG
jgi:hypothetical protein